MTLVRWKQIFFKLSLIFFMLFSAGLMTACSGKDDKSAGAPEVSPTNESGWDKMVWDQGKWG